MVSKENIIALTERELGFKPIPGQKEVISRLADFIANLSERDVFILNGYAGTGKTSVMGALVRSLSQLRIPTVILAPTGRAAKVAGQMAGKGASTIHRRIYHPVGDGPTAKVSLSPNRNKDTIFIVDEASLITDSRDSRSVLEHLVRHVYSGERCNMIFVGDTAQLPPVGQENSPAMQTRRLEELGLSVSTGLLDVPVRQAAESGILHNATIVRQAITTALQSVKKPKLPDIFSNPAFINAPRNILPSPPSTSPPEIDIPQLDLRGFSDIRVISSADMADELATSWANYGPEQTLIVTRSNARANRFNMAVRNMVMFAEEPLQRGERIVISHNDYYWKQRNSQRGFISNGETAIVNWFGHTEKVYGRYFVDVELYFPSDGSTVGAKLMLRSLMAEGPSIPNAEMQRFFTHVVEAQEGSDYEKMSAAILDPYYNALQAKYAYCVTCHKAQGGQWRDVYVDMGGITSENMDITFLRWLYTAMTRSTERLTLINPTIPIIES